jgi:Mg-chelatase subunit ChlD
MQTRKSSLFVLAVLFTVNLACFADKRTENIDIILALDKSLSMGEEQKMDAVTRYANTWLLDEVLIPGDFLVVIAFYGKAEVIISETVSDEAAKQQIKNKISQIRGNGSFTDIGNSLDVMKTQMEKYKDDGRKKFVLMMTDGIQEAPPYSKYYTNRTKYNYEFIENTKTIQQQGWKIEILGIGTEAEVQDLAQQLQGSYAQLTDDLSVETIKTQTENLLGTVTLVGGVRVSPVGIGGSSSLILNLKSEGYSNPVSISISGVEIRLPAQTITNAITAPCTITVGASGITTGRVPVQFPSDLTPGKYDGTIVFTFASGERFNPSEMTTEVSVNGLVENYWWLAIIALVALAVLIILLIFLIRRFFTARPLRFHLFVDDESLSVQPIVLKASGERFLNESADVFTVVSKRNARTLARFRLKEGVLGFDILKEERFPKTEGPVEDALGKSFVMRSEHGENRKLTVAAVQARAKPSVAAPKIEEKRQQSVKLTMVQRSTVVTPSPKRPARKEGKKAAGKRSAPARKKRGA